MGQLPWQRRLLLPIIGILGSLSIASIIFAAGQWVAKPFPGFFIHANRSVGPYFLPTWTGGQSGLRTLDQVVAVNGLPLVTRDQLYSQVRSVPAGTTFTYSINRAGQLREVRIDSMALTIGDWLMSFGVYVLMGVAFLVIGVAPYYFRSSSPAALPMCFMVLADSHAFSSDFLKNQMVTMETSL